MIVVPQKPASSRRVEHPRAVDLVAERHKGELRQRLSHLFAVLRLDDEHEEAAAASAAEFAAFSPRLDGARIVAVDLCGRNLGGETALQIPAAVKSFAQ